ncbi:MAG: DUF5362 family protein [Ignavibacteriales bacterium]|jgi:hypothetical protein|nr:MAG: hypothetical protein F9K26_09555 [Ignavibacteriaceae bacterium]MBW7872686.1 hypothetical protein [Ignavibacteria bacterium]MCZ2143407.1 DUF5362 family protein [Ignavibacteriales bacterium]OQY74081.1 MAG: hypothetical protein B6D45_07270 [Ignavibacteriales bacterium UTCHB3]MBV6444286.1 hypothetical protein [Ignavibacteriaceae bacterium]
MQSDMLMNDTMLKLASDSKLVGILYMVIGGLLILLGLLIGEIAPFILVTAIAIVPIFIGLRARKGGQHIERLIGTNDPNDKIVAYENYQKHFAVLKVVLIIGNITLATMVLGLFEALTKLSSMMR